MTGAPPPGSLTAGTVLRRGSGERLTVGKRLAEGGQGFVYEIQEDPNLVFKQIKQAALEKYPEIPQRLAAMIRQKPTSWREQGSGHVLLAWPIEEVLNRRGFVGFLMPRISANAGAELHNVTNLSDRTDTTSKAPAWIRGFTWRYHLRIASNLALAVDILHQGGFVIGDFNDRNVLVSKEARVTVIDCDSMQVPNPDGSPFLCVVSREEFSAPELRKIDIRKTPRAATSDLFPLAVHIHQLLLAGAHPFHGRWSGAEKPPRAELAAAGIFVNSKDPRLVPGPWEVDYDLVPPAIHDLFRRAFVSGAQDPSVRPRGREWRASLDAVAASLIECSHDREHVYPGHHQQCPWCTHAARRAAVQTPLPPAKVPAPPPPTVAAPTVVPRPVIAPRPVVPPRPVVMPPPVVAATPAVATPGARAPIRPIPPPPVRPAPAPRTRRTAMRWVLGLVAAAGVVVAIAVQTSNPVASAGGDSPAAEPSTGAAQRSVNSGIGGSGNVKHRHQAKQTPKVKHARKVKRTVARKPTTAQGPGGATVRRSTAGVSAASRTAAKPAKPPRSTSRPAGGGGASGGGLSGSGGSGTGGGGDGLTGSGGPGSGEGGLTGSGGPSSGRGGLSGGG